MFRVPTTSHESKLRTFQGHFQDQKIYLKDLHGKFHNADMSYAENLLLKWRKLSVTTVQKSPFYLTEWFLPYGRKLTKHNYPSTQAAYKIDHIIFDNQTFIPQSVKNKDFSLTFLQELLKLSTFPVPKDPCSKVRTFPGNEDPWEPWMLPNGQPSSCPKSPTTGQFVWLTCKR